jgi:hypothetical protein
VIPLKHLAQASQLAPSEAPPVEKRAPPHVEKRALCAHEQVYFFLASEGLVADEKTTVSGVVWAYAVASAAIRTSTRVSRPLFCGAFVFYFGYHSIVLVMYNRLCDSRRIGGYSSSWT